MLDEADKDLGTKAFEAIAAGCMGDAEARPSFLSPSLSSTTEFLALFRSQTAITLAMLQDLSRSAPLRGP